MMAKKLLLVFKNIKGTTSTLTIDEPKDNLTEAEVKNVMDTIIEKNIFNSTGGDLIEIKSAEIITTTEEILM